MNENLNISAATNSRKGDVDNFSRYSYDEVVVGEWVDGKPIYRKVIETTSPTKNIIASVYDCTELNIEEVISLGGTIAVGGTSYALTNTYMNADQNMYLMYSKYSKSLKQKVSHEQLQNKPEKIIIEYTKSDGEAEIIEKITTESGRTIYRHPNNMGSVIEFDMYDNPVSLFVADSKYFKKLQYSTDNNLPKINSSLTSFTLSRTAAALPAMNDETLASKLKMSLNIQNYAKYMCDSHKTAISSAAINYTRSLIGLVDEMGCDVPNMYELAVICIEADYIQKLDPTYSNSNTLYIGYNESTKIRWSTEAWTCTPYANTSYPHIISVSSTNCSIGTARNADTVDLVIPIRELGIY